MSDALSKAIEDAVAGSRFGKASAAKRGRNPAFPYVPIINHGTQAIGVHRTRTEQINGRAFETRDEAVTYADRVIKARQNALAKDLALPRMRALRKQHGLPEEIVLRDGIPYPAV